MEKYPLSHLFGATFLSRDGRFIANRPSITDFQKAPNNNWLESEMFWQARGTIWPLRVAAYIDPCRFEIQREHQPSLRDLAFLVEHNPFIPPGHEVLFLRGIHAGFQGDMMLCAHLLIPQVEQSIRYVLKSRGVVTSTLDSNLIQKERSLNELMLMAEAIEIFTDNLLFELRGILCEKLGFDLRNRLAHGFVTAEECNGPDVTMIWWLIIRICASPIYVASKQAVADESLTHDDSNVGK